MKVENANVNMRLLTPSQVQIQTMRMRLRASSHVQIQTCLIHQKFCRTKEMREFQRQYLSILRNMPTAAFQNLQDNKSPKTAKPQTRNCSSQKKTDRFVKKLFRKKFNQPMSNKIEKIIINTQNRILDATGPFAILRQEA